MSSPFDWQTATLNSGFSVGNDTAFNQGLGGQFQAPAFRFESHDVVRLAGCVIRQEGYVAFTLPTDYRPPYKRLISDRGDSNVVVVYPNGDVCCYAGAGPFFLDGSFSL